MYMYMYIYILYTPIFPHCVHMCLYISATDIHMLALRYLDISCNQVTALPNNLRHIEDTLKIFKMADNPIESPPTQVRHSLTF